MNKIAFIFPGQGAQYVGMGKDFYNAFAIARETFEEASDALSHNLTELIFEGPEDVLSETQNSQPAIFVMSVAILRVVHERFSLNPSICAGLSLGEYTALFAAGKIAFAECLQIVAARGVFMQKACQEQEGTMKVVLGLDPEIVKAHLPKDVWIANLNCPGQVVIAGRASAMLAAEEALKAHGAKRVLPIDVSGAFHTPLMHSAQRRLDPQLRAAKLEESPVQIVMNVSGDFASLDEIRSNLIDQVASTTRWEQGVRKMEQAGVDLYLEMGPGTTLAGMNRKIGVQAPTISIGKEADLMTLESAMKGDKDAITQR